ncbi:MAG: hypothetical protein Q8N99_01315 [Nanoarchaeota archaeon]|nr:hypothetical protein [Nanoarchaeota archaeon]
MTDEPRFIQDIPPVQINRALYSAIARERFDRANELLRANGYHMPSLEEAAKLRVQERPTLKTLEDEFGDLPPIFAGEIGTTMHFVYVPGDGVYLTKKSIFLDGIQKASEVFAKPLIQQKGPYCLDEHELDLALADSILLIKADELSAELNSQRVEIPWKHLHEDPRTIFAFGKETARNYGALMIEEFPHSSDSLKIWYPGKELSKPYAYGLSLGGISDDDSSELNYYIPFFHHDSVAIRGVKNI